MTAERKSGLILAAIAAIEGVWVLINLRFNGWRFLRYLGFAPGLSGTIAGWIAALFVTIIFIALAMRLPSVRETLLQPSLLKLLAIAVAITAGILEEAVFRRWTMNWLMGRGYGAIVQVLGSGLLFGAAHGVWGLMGKSVRDGFLGPDAGRRFPACRPQPRALHRFALSHQPLY